MPLVLVFWNPKMGNTKRAIEMMAQNDDDFDWEAMDSVIP
jgi:hypothetical protein